MQKIIDGKTEIIIDGETVTVNGRVARFEAESEVHPFLKDVPKENETAYTLTSSQVSPIGRVFQCEIDKGTVSLNRDALVELDNRRLAETALKKWIGENNIPVATEDQMDDPYVWKYGFRYNYHIKRVGADSWAYLRPVGDIHFLSQVDLYKVRDNCAALIRKAYGWPEAK